MLTIVGEGSTGVDWLAAESIYTLPQCCLPASMSRAPEMQKASITPANNTVYRCFLVTMLSFPSEASLLLTDACVRWKAGRNQLHYFVKANESIDTG